MQSINQKFDSPELTDQENRKLNDIFSDDNQLLKEELDVDISYWKWILIDEHVNLLNNSSY